MTKPVELLGGIYQLTKGTTATLSLDESYFEQKKISPETLFVYTGLSYPFLIFEHKGTGLLFEVDFTLEEVLKGINLAETPIEEKKELLAKLKENFGHDLNEWLRPYVESSSFILYSAYPGFHTPELDFFNFALRPTGQIIKVEVGSYAFCGKDVPAQWGLSLMELPSNRSNTIRAYWGSNQLPFPSMYIPLEENEIMSENWITSTLDPKRRIRQINIEFNKNGQVEKDYNNYLKKYLQVEYNPKTNLISLEGKDGLMIPKGTTFPGKLKYQGNYPARSPDQFPPEAHSYLMGS